MFLQWPPAQENEKGAAHIITYVRASSQLLRSPENTHTLGEGLAEKAAEPVSVRIFPR